MSTILVIEDDVMTLQVIERILGNLLPKYELALFELPEKALEWFEINYDKCCLIISDYKMPVLNGKALMLKLNAIKKVHSIMISAYVNLDMNEGILEKKVCNALLSKPISKYFLEQTINLIKQGEIL